ncbi:MAG: tetratricopeptide repeat protein, partial [Chloroflexales bacterium]|nr:tetratricopeptide repeat protein [Chloroflexales bacterium]
RIDIAYAVRLTGMPVADALALIAHEAASKAVALPPDAPAELVRRTGGLPLALVWSIGLMSVGHHVDAVLRRLGNGDSDIARFCFSESAARIHGRAPERLLLALALFERSVSRAMLGIVAGLDDDPLGRDDGLAELVQLSLINQKDDRFDALPLTQRFALDLLQQQPVLEDELRTNWIGLLSDLARPYASVHHVQPSPLPLMQEGKHLIGLADWARRNERADIVLDILPALLYYSDTMGDWADVLTFAHNGLEQAALLGREAEMPRMLCAIAWVQSQQGLHAAAEQALGRALGVARQLGDRVWEIESLSRLAQTVRRRGDLTAAAAFCDAAYALVGALPEPLATYTRVDLDYERGKICRDQGDWAGARQHFQAVRRVFNVDDESPAFNVERAWGVLGNVAHVLAQLGEHAEAERLFRQSLDFFRQFGGRGYTATLLVRLAALEARQGNRTGALDHAREALDLSQKLGMVQERQQAELILAQLAPDRAGGTSA